MRPSLSPDESKALCVQCGACCLTGSLFVTDSEAEWYMTPGTPVTFTRIVMTPDGPLETHAVGGVYVRLDLMGGCRFLDRDTMLCAIYEARPQACREFPTAPTVGCLIWPPNEEKAPR